MFNPVEPDTPSGRTRRWPSLGRTFFWWYALGIPLIAVGAGVALLIASNQLDASVQTYRKAGPCLSASITAACYTMVPGTLVTFSISRGKSGDTTDMTLQLPDDMRSTWAKTSWQQEDALHVGAPVQAKFYQGALATVYVGGVGIQTKDNPIYKQSDMRLAAVMFPVLGLIIAGISFFSRRGRKQTKVGSIVAIDPALPIAEQERRLRNALLGVPTVETPHVRAASHGAGVTLPFTLRPHPIPTGRPWWVGLIIAAIAMPLLLLRMRTPAAIAQVVLAATVATMLAAVVLHWLYRNRRMLVVDDLSVRRVSMFGAARVVSRSDVARVACPIVMSFGLPAAEQRLLLLDAGGRCLLGLRRYYSTDEEAAQLATALRVPLDNKLASSLTTPPRLRRTIPGAVGWSEAHPVLMTIVLIPPILVAVGLFVWMLDGFK